MSKQLENLLRQSGLLTEAQIARSAEQARKKNVSLLDVVLKDENVSEDALADAFSTRMKLPRVRVAATAVDPEALGKVPDRIARKYFCLPLSIDGRVMTLAMADPADYQAIQDVEFASALSVRPVVATRTEILDGIEEHYAAEDRIGSFLANVPEATDLQIVSEEASDLSVDVLGDGRAAAEVAPVVKMCNLVIYDAIKAGASDLHIEPTLHDVQVRMRIDGVLRDYTHVPKWLHSPVVSRLKILAKLDIAERRLPQDGRINVQYQGRSIDIRVSTLPTHFGEKAVLRFLGSSSLPKIDRMGFDPDQLAILESAISQPQGMILVTGPTGSGKTTTLYALLARRRSPEVNIVTVEDPIEYQLPGINQVQINPKAGLSFAGVLRSILRQDPDVILVGETRDQETAEVGFQAAMTGHLVLTTLHTNSAVAAIPRLYDLEVDPSILATSLTLVVAQRLVRRICDQCREAYTPDRQIANRVGLTAADGVVYRGRGCSSCSNTGYQGRLGIYEFFRPTNSLRKLIHARAGEPQLRAAARSGGMRMLRDDALEKVKQGLTSPDEVLRVVQVDETDVACPSCGAMIEADFATCPYCRTSLKKTCENCGQELKREWNACPYCNMSSLIVPLGAGLSESKAGRPGVPLRTVTHPPTARPPAPVAPKETSQGASAQPADSFTTPIVHASHATPADHELSEAERGFVEGASDPKYPGMRVIELSTPAKTGPQIRHRQEPARPRVETVASPAPPPPETPAVKAPPPAAAPSPMSMPERDLGDIIAEAAAVIQPRTGHEHAGQTAEVVAPPQPPSPPSSPPQRSFKPAPKPTAAPPPPPEPVAPLSLDEPVALLPPDESITPMPEAAAPHAAPVPNPAEDPVRRLRVLVVDDDDDIRQVVAFTLRTLPIPVDIEQAVDGQQAIDMAEAHPPDLVVLDIMMPGIDGFETCARLRQSVRTAFVPILMLTGSADEMSRSKGYIVGTDDYMSKPFQPLDLKLRVTRLIRRTYGM